MSEKLDFPGFLEQVGVLSSDVRKSLFSGVQATRDVGSQVSVLRDKTSIDQQTLDYYVAEWQQTEVTLLENVDDSCTRELPEKSCRRYQMIAFKWDKDTLCVAVLNPYDDGMIAAISQWLQCPYRMYVASKQSLERALNRSFRQTTNITRLARTAKGVVASDKAVKKLADGIDRLDSKASVVSLVDHILQDALQCMATDIHIESNFNHLVYYYRVGHESADIVNLPVEISDMLVQRLIILGDGDIAQKNLPQDLGFTFRRQGTDETINVRLSILFTQTGYSVVMRLLLSESEVHPLEDLLVEKKSLDTVLDFLRTEHGMMLVTGPTASGKTTLLYSLLKRIHDGQKKMISIEDPIEVQFSHLNQVQVNPDIGLDFSAVIRSSLRQNPDVLMVGEVRDKETAMMAMRSAITGVLVFSTIHTSDTKKTVIRLIDLGVDPFLIGSALRLVLSTRLLKRVCDSCQSKPRSLTDDEKRLLGDRLSNNGSLQVVEGAGCQICHQTGSRGLTLIAETLSLTLSLQECIIRGDFEGFETEADKILEGGRLVDSAKALVEQGIIPISELIKLVCDT